MEEGEKRIHRWWHSIHHPTTKILSRCHIKKGRDETDAQDEGSWAQRWTLYFQRINHIYYSEFVLQDREWSKAKAPWFRDLWSLSSLIRINSVFSSGSFVFRLCAEMTFKTHSRRWASHFSRLLSDDCCNFLHHASSRASFIANHEINTSANQTSPLVAANKKTCCRKTELRGSFEETHTFRRLFFDDENFNKCLGDSLSLFRSLKLFPCSLQWH